jgi:hypothetical protein
MIRQSCWNESANPHSSSSASPLPRLPSSNSARSFVPVAPPVHRLNVIGMVVSLGSSHPSWVDVVGHDVVVVGELYMAECALPVLFDNLAVEQPPHLRVGAEFPVSPRMMRILNSLQAQLTQFSNPRDWLPATAGQRTMDGTILITAKFHRIFSRWFCRDRRRMRSHFGFEEACPVWPGQLSWSNRPS